MAAPAPPAGNWSTDIAGGSAYNYDLLFVILLSSVLAMILQSFCVRLGAGVGKDLAQVGPHTTPLRPARKKHLWGLLRPPSSRRARLITSSQACRERYPPKVSFCLWILAECAIAACDLAEVIGSAIAINLLSGLPIIAGVFITAADVLIVLMAQVRIAALGRHRPPPELLISIRLQRPLGRVASPVRPLTACLPTLELCSSTRFESLSSTRAATSVGWRCSWRPSSSSLAAASSLSSR